MYGFDKIEETLENGIDKALLDLNDAIVVFHESTSEFNCIYEEASVSNLITNIKKFITRIVMSFVEFVTSIKIEVESQVEAVNFRNSLMKLHKELMQKKSEGIKVVTVKDVWAVKDAYVTSVKKLEKYAEKFTKMNVNSKAGEDISFGKTYKSTVDINKDLEIFNKLYEECNKDIENAMEKTQTVQIDNFIRFIDKECSKNGDIIQTIEESSRNIKKMGKEASMLTKRVEILGPDVIEKHVGFFGKVISAIGRFIKRWSAKIITFFCIKYASPTSLIG